MWLLGPILAHQSTKFEIREWFCFSRHPWGPWGRQTSGMKPKSADFVSVNCRTGLFIWRPGKKSHQKINFLNLNTNISYLKITLCDKKFIKHITLHLKCCFNGKKAINISWKKAQKVDFWELLDPYLGFTLKTVPGIHDPHISWLLDLMITLWNQKSRNAGTPCIWFQTFTHQTIGFKIEKKAL